MPPPALELESFSNLFFAGRSRSAKSFKMFRPFVESIILKLFYLHPVVDVVKTILPGKLYFHKIKKLKIACSDVWTCTKMWKQWGYFQAKLCCKTVLCFENDPFLLFWLKGKSGFSRFSPKKFYNINYWHLLSLAIDTARAGITKSANQVGR